MLNKINKILLVTILALSTFLICTTFKTTKVSAVEYDLNKNINSFINTISEEIDKNPELRYNSNPYVLIKNDKAKPYYDKIVQLGPNALPYIIQTIENSNKNGLREYILAAAGEDISKIYLKRGQFKWSNGKEWIDDTKNYVEKVPSLVNDIVNSNVTIDNKIDKLKSLGIYAIPYIVDSVQSGNYDLIPAVENNISSKTFASSYNNIDEWVARNNELYGFLKNITK